jgi:hypothetical protein
VKKEVVWTRLIMAVVVRIGWRWIGVIIPRASCAVLDMLRDHSADKTGVVLHIDFRV